MFTKNEKFEVTEVGDGSILLVDDQGNIHSLNRTAKLIYDLCLQGLNFEEICDYIKKDYKTDMTLNEKVRTCIDSFINKKILI